MKNTDLLRIEILLAIWVLLEQLSRAMPEKFVICDLELKCTVVPSIVELSVVRVYKGKLFICEASDTVLLDKRI